MMELIAACSSSGDIQRENDFENERTLTASLLRIEHFSA
jgi:hypothetical protein